ncbi:MAG TPA: YCF48-related protein [Steroidobacteraceae bacterium]|nr:YCF48-related protein [Steroidobacteraceae bacterium]
MKHWLRAAYLWMAAVSVAVPVANAQEEAAPAAARGKTVVEIKPNRIVLIDIARVGERLAAVGERGFVLLSDDAGKTWRARETPVTRTLTGIAFRDAKVGVAVGHGGSFVRTEDGGENWAHVSVPEAEPESLLGVVSLGGDHFAAYGAFGMYFDSADAGRTWVRQTVLAEDFEWHISQVIPVGETLIMVAESGTLARSDDGGATWSAITSPYVGSYFGVLATASGTVVAFGMRGNVYRSADLGATWQKVPLNTTASLNGGRVLSDGRILLVGNSGLLALSKDDGQTLDLHWAPSGRGFAAAVEADGRIILAGESGVTPLDPAWLESR